MSFNVWNVCPEVTKVLKQYGPQLLRSPKRTRQSLSKGTPCGGKKSTCNMHNVCRLLSGHQELSLFLCSGKKTKPCDMFIKQQGSHYCTQQSLSQCSHIAACTCSLGTGRLIVTLLSVMQFFLSTFLNPSAFHLFALCRWHTCRPSVLGCPGKSLQNAFSPPPRT